ncbi:hypothetical protein WISP_118789 [Willisornis vidua]|uniref:Uncharacterized protein n=1 Tax=Willisornis vidua TaxID=1566151 RepID=A0ABQ9CYQ2_9PASS|nr:hypothetical protein WISP_118789 [Willisornis vidua]
MMAQASLKRLEHQLPPGFAGVREVPSPPENFCMRAEERALPCKCYPQVQKWYQEMPLDSVIHKTFMKVNDCSVRD